MSSVAGLVLRDRAAAALLQRASAWLQQTLAAPAALRSTACGVHAGSAAPADDDDDSLPAGDLFVHDDGRTLAYSDSLQTLVGLLTIAGIEAAPDARGWAELLAGGAAHSKHTLLQNVQRRRAIKPAAEPAAAPLGEGDAMQQLSQQLDAAVSAALHGATSAGILLSGGLKSAAIALSARRAGIDLSLYSVGLAGSDDFTASRQIAAACGCDAIELRLGDDELRAAAEGFIHTLDEPLAQPCSVALQRLALRVHERQALLLAGDDDGLFGHTHASAGFDAQAWLREPTQRPGFGPRAQSRAGLAGTGLAARPQARTQQANTAQARHPWRDTTLQDSCAQMPARWGRSPRQALQQHLAASLPPALAQRAPAQLAIAPGLLLRAWRERLLHAIDTLRGSALAELLQLDAIAGFVAAYFAGETRSGFAVWRLALPLLWWAEVLPAWRAAALASAVPGAAVENVENVANVAPLVPVAHLTPVAPVAPLTPLTPAAPAAPPSAAATITARQRLVVYTVLVGAKEALADPLAALPAGSASDLELDFVCLTDNPALQSPSWRFVLMPGGHLAPEKLSRRPKAMPHEYFPEHTFSLYIDNTVAFKRLPQASDLHTAQPLLFRAFRHATRVNPEQEATAVAMLGYDDVATICRQMAFYAEHRPLASITPLTTATVLLRQHHAPAVQRFGTLWWESILAFSKRDQLSFDFARQEAGLEVEYFDGGTHDNELITWQGSLSQHRVRASFDDRRYAWLHRNEPDALRDPRAHFLQHHRGSDEAFQKPAPLLEFLCQAQGSSLGRQVSPRRAVAETLEELLLPHRRAGQRWLLVRVQGQGPDLPQAFDETEFEAAARTLSMYMAPAQGTLIDVQASELQGDGNVVFVGKAAFDSVVLLGASAAQLPALLAKLQRLLPAAGSLVAVLAGPATLAEALAAETWLATQLAADARAQLNAAQHDDQHAPLANALLSLRWTARADAADAADAGTTGAAATQQEAAA